MGIVKIAGYIIAIAGLVLIATGIIPAIRTTLSFIPSSITSMYIIIAGVVLVVIGIIPILKSGGSVRKGTEIPIYHGKEVVGFRRV